MIALRLILFLILALFGSQTVALGQNDAEFVATNSSTLRFRNSTGGGRSIFASQDALDNALLDPALYGTRLTTTPTFNPSLFDDGLTIGLGLDARVEIGPSAFSSRENLLRTIIHEEAHMRLDIRAANGSHRADLLQSARILEEDYVERVAERFVRMFGPRGE